PLLCTYADIWMKIGDARSIVSVNPAVRSQNDRLRTACAAVQRGSSSVGVAIAEAGLPGAWLSPSGCRPRSSGRRRIAHQASGAIAQIERPMITQAARQLSSDSTDAISGASTRPAVAEPKVKYMIAWARLRMNQLEIAATGP